MCPVVGSSSERLEWVATSCSELQCGAVWRSVLQYVAVCCSTLRVLQCVMLKDPLSYACNGFSGLQ